MTALPMPVRIREFMADDIAFVRSAWLHGAQHLAGRLGLNPVAAKRRAERLLQHEATRVLVACNPEMESHMFGFVAFSAPNVLHWIYVPKTWREIGLGKTLAAAAVPSFGKDMTITSSRCLGWPVRSAKFRVVFASALGGIQQEKAA